MMNVLSIINNDTLIKQMFPLVADAENINADTFKNIFKKFFEFIKLNDLSVEIQNGIFEKTNISSDNIQITFTSAMFEGTAKIVFSESDLRSFVCDFIIVGIDPMDISNNLLNEILKKLFFVFGFTCNQESINVSPAIVDEQSNEMIYKIHIIIGNQEKKYGFDFMLSEQALNSWNNRNNKKYLLDLNDKSISNNINVILRFIIGEARLLSEELLSIEKGDCVILNWNSFDDGKNIINIEIDNNSVFRGSFKNNQIKLEEYILVADSSKKNQVNFDDKGINDNKENFSQGDYSEFVKNLEIFVKAELGTMSKNIMDVAQMQPGNILDFKSDGTIYLTVNGNVIATGRLVKVGDLIGVQIINSPVK